MSKAMSGGGGGSDLLLVAAIIIGAMIYTRSAGAGAGVLATRPRVVTMPTTASGATGNGTQQVVAGLTTGLAAWLSNMARGMPDTYNASPATGGYNSFGTLGPIGGTPDDPWYG